MPHVPRIPGIAGGRRCDVVHVVPTEAENRLERAASDRAQLLVERMRGWDLASPAPSPKPARKVRR